MQNKYEVLSNAIDINLYKSKLFRPCQICGESFEIFVDERICEKCCKAILWARKQMEGK